MKKNYVVSICLAIVVALSSIVFNQTASAQKSDSLYKRLGGYDALAEVTDDFIVRLATDPKVGRFFTGLSDNSKARVRQLVVDQLCAATGGPCVYIGRDMKTAHKGLGITEEDWNISVRGAPILGVFTNSAKAFQQGNAAAKTLVIKGVAIMGGVEVKN